MMLRSNLENHAAARRPVGRIAGGLAQPINLAPHFGVPHPSLPCLGGGFGLTGTTVPPITDINAHLLQAEVGFEN